MCIVSSKGINYPLRSTELGVEKTADETKTVTPESTNLNLEKAKKDGTYDDADESGKSDIIDKFTLFKILLSLEFWGQEINLSKFIKLIERSVEDHTRTFWYIIWLFEI